MNIYSRYKDGKKIVETTQPRIEKIKELSSKIREQIMEKEDNLFSDEIDIFITFLNAELKYCILEKDEVLSQTRLNIKKAKLKNPILYRNIEKPD